MRIKDMKQPFTIEMTNTGISFFLYVPVREAYMYESLYIIDRKHFVLAEKIYYN